MKTKPLKIPLAVGVRVGGEKSTKKWTLRLGSVVVQGPTLADAIQAASPKEKSDG